MSETNGQHRQASATTTTRAVAALAIRAVTRGDTEARADIERLAPGIDYATLELTVEIATQVIAELVNFPALQRIYYFEEPT